TYRPCAVPMGNIQMKENVGQLTPRSLIVGMLICLTIGIVIFRHFTFRQRIAPQDATAVRINDLEKRMAETEATLDQLKETLNRVTTRMAQSGPVNPGSKKRH